MDIQESQEIKDDMIESAKTYDSNVLKFLCANRWYLIFWIFYTFTHIVFVIVSIWLVIIYFIRNILLILAIMNIIAIFYFSLKLPFLYIKYNKEQKTFLIICSFYMDLLFAVILFIYDIAYGETNKLDEKEEERLLFILIIFQAFTCVIFFLPSTYHLQSWIEKNWKHFIICFFNTSEL